jgi:spore coat protein U-like protein
MRNLITALLTTGALLGAAGSASAATTTTTFTVTATVNTNCKVSAANLAFSYTPGAGAVNNSSNITVNCTKGTPFNTELSAGGTTGSTIAQRLLNDGAAGDTLQYNLYTTAGMTIPWGTTIGTNTVAGVGGGMGAGAAVTQTVFGQVVDSAVNQADPPGTYTDTITVTVAY